MTPQKLGFGRFDPLNGEWQQLDPQKACTSGFVDDVTFSHNVKQF